MITVVPEIKTEKLSSNCEFLLIACDGIWDCMSNQEAVDMVKEWQKSPSGKGNLSKSMEDMFDKIIASDVASSGKSPSF